VVTEREGPESRSDEEALHAALACCEDELRLEDDAVKQLWVGVESLLADVECRVLPEGGLERPPGVRREVDEDVDLVRLAEPLLRAEGKDMRSGGRQRQALETEGVGGSGHQGASVWKPYLADTKLLTFSSNPILVSLPPIFTRIPLSSPLLTKMSNLAP